MHITRTSLITGKKSTREIRNISEQDIKDCAESGENIQDFFPHLSADDREFIKTGITPEEWATPYE